MKYIRKYFSAERLLTLYVTTDVRKRHHILLLDVNLSKWGKKPSFMYTVFTPPLDGYKMLLYKETRYPDVLHHHHQSLLIL